MHTVSLDLDSQMYTIDIRELSLYRFNIVNIYILYELRNRGTQSEPDQTTRVYIDYLVDNF